ncbi:MAG: hypothetical protein Q8916_12415 [Bacteroidota bacterium]|nr:hypothetical protein [Bacteroidota bacterium]MDP4231196.1 hypothetical protein [Bacteroidota bacterium]MDP4235337.1 hypothetical protein [Bacteroidota bacterium]
MKTSSKILATAAFMLAIGISNSFGALNAYLKISGQKGYSKIVKITCPDGSCSTTVDGLKAGKYTISLCNAQGTLMKVKEKGNRTKCTASLSYEIVSPRDAASGLPTGKMATSSNDGSVVSPRDPASGLPTGKRMHKPFVITKELDVQSPFTVGVDVDGDGTSITFQKISWTSSDGKIMASDDWEAPTN